MSGRTIGTNLPSGHYTFAGLAEETGVPVGTLRRWVRLGQLQPVETQPYGKLDVKVFDQESVDRVNVLRGITSESNPSD